MEAASREAVDDSFPADYDLAAHGQGEMSAVTEGEVSQEVLHRLHETLQAVQSVLKSSRKDRWRFQKQHKDRMAQVKNVQAECQQEIDRGLKQSEMQLSVVKRLSLKTQEMVDAPNGFQVVKDAAAKHRLEKGLKAMACILRSDSAQLPDSISGTEVAELRGCREMISERYQRAQQIKAEKAAVIEEVQRTREIRADQHADTQTTSDTSHQLFEKDGQGDERRRLQILCQELSRSLEVETELSCKASAALPACALVTPVATPAVENALTATDSVVGADEVGVPSAAIAAVASNSVSSNSGVSGPSLPNNVPASSASDARGAEVAAPLAQKACLAAVGKAFEPTHAKAIDVPKGKGKGKAPVPKCPMKGPPPSKAASVGLINGSQVNKKSRSNLVAFHWKVHTLATGMTKAPQAKCLPMHKDAAEFADYFMTSSSAASTPALLNARATRRQALLLHEGAEDERCHQDVVGEPPVLGSASTVVRRDSVFASKMPVKMLPTPLLETMFKARSTVKLRSASADADRLVEERKALFEEKHLRMLGIALTKHRMKMKGDTALDCALSIKRGILQCDYDAVETEVLALIHPVLKQHAENDFPVKKLVLEKGEAALLRLDNSMEHRLVYELLKVPQIGERLECMIFQIQFEHLLSLAARQLEALKQAVEVLERNRDLLRTLFLTLLSIGRNLNKDSRAPQASRGFQLTSIQKMIETKSTKSSKFNILHFALAAMSRDDVRQLFAVEDIALLGAAKTIKTVNVKEDCLELVQGFYGVREICETGNYKSRSNSVKIKMEHKRKTLCPGSRIARQESSNNVEDGETPIDNDDHFHDEMKLFVESNLEKIQRLATDCFGVLRKYKDLALWLDDASFVYPPPTESNTGKEDLIAFFHKLAEQVKAHREDVRQGNVPSFSTVASPASADAADSSTATTLSTVESSICNNHLAAAETGASEDGAVRSKPMAQSRSASPGVLEISARMLH